nr:7-deoxyloganetin glucosyltransferase-like [Ipomoea batatas]
MARPHAVCIPFPAQGHINPMLQLAKLLHHKGFHITFVNNEFNHDRLLRSRGSKAMEGLPSLRFEAIPDGLPPSNPDATQDVASLTVSSTNYCLDSFRELVKRLNDHPSSESPPVTCIVSDGTMSFTHKVADELCIPNVFFWTCSTCGLDGYVHYRQLAEKNFTPINEPNCLTNGYLDTVIDWIPGLKGIPAKYLPSFIWNSGQDDDPNYVISQFAIREVEAIPKASAIILNTFDELEPDAISALRSKFPGIYTIGPLHLLRNQFSLGDDLKSIGCNLWKEDPYCLEWLDTKDAGSVVYVNYGSVTVMTPEQLLEFAWGLANSKFTFLWIIRPDLLRGESAILPPDFLTETRERGLLASWCPQEQVLNHPSVGCFLTHCGWNSTLESISAGVPMLCWPFFSEQPTNCWYCCTELGVGMEIDSNGDRNVIGDLVREMMGGEKGKEMKEKVMKLKKLAEAVVASPAGPSYLNFEEIVNNVLIPPTSK